MKPDIVSAIEGIILPLVPVLLSLVLAIFSVIPVEIPGYSSVTPNLFLMSLYHWTLYRPRHLPYASIFMIGLLIDLLTSAPGGTIGLQPLVFLLIRNQVLANRRYFVDKSFPYVWWGFALTAISVSLFLWVAGSALNNRFLEPRSFAFQTVLTVGLFPIMSWVFVQIQRATTPAN